VILPSTPATGILAPEMQDSRIYPNPAKSHIYVQVYSDAVIPLKVEIIDVTGTLRYATSAFRSGNTINAIDLPESLQNGLYIIRLRNRDAKIIFTEKIVIHK